MNTVIDGHALLLAVAASCLLMAAAEIGLTRHDRTALALAIVGIAALGAALVR